MIIAPICMLLLTANPVAEDGPIMSPKIEQTKIEDYTTGTLPPIVKSVMPDKFQVPKIEIEGIDQDYNVGDLVELKIKPLEKLPENLKSSIFVWTVLPEPKKIATWPDNSQIVFGTGPKDQEYTIILHATFTFVLNNSIEHRAVTSISKCVIGVNNIKPEKVTAAKGIDKLQDFTRRVTASLEPITKDNYDDATKRSDIKKLAASFRKLSSLLAAQKSLAPLTIITMQGEENKEALGANLDAYINWFEDLNKNIRDYYGDKNLSATDFSEIYRIIATALEAY